MWCGNEPTNDVGDQSELDLGLEAHVGRAVATRRRSPVGVVVVAAPAARAGVAVTSEARATVPRAPAVAGLHPVVRLGPRTPGETCLPVPPRPPRRHQSASSHLQVRTGRKVLPEKIVEGQAAGDVHAGVGAGEVESPQCPLSRQCLFPGPISSTVYAHLVVPVPWSIGAALVQQISRIDRPPESPLLGIRKSACDRQKNRRRSRDGGLLDSGGFVQSTRSPSWAVRNRSMTR